MGCNMTRRCCTTAKCPYRWATLPVPFRPHLFIVAPSLGPPRRVGPYRSNRRPPRQPPPPEHRSAAGKPPPLRRHLCLAWDGTLNLDRPMHHEPKDLAGCSCSPEGRCLLTVDCTIVQLSACPGHRSALCAQTPHTLWPHAMGRPSCSWAAPG
jgi:hypothetical protein